MKFFRKLSLIVVSLAVILFFTGMPLYTAKATFDKGPLKEKVFIFQPTPDNFDWFYGHNKGKPPAPKCTVTTNDNVNDWGATGWHMPSAGMTYKINYSTLPRNLSSSTFQSATRTSFDTWTNADSAQKWFYGGSTTAKRATYDGTNLIAFGRISGNAIAVTYIWYYSGSGEVAESDTIFSSSLAWSITDSSAGDCGGVAGTYDVQDIGTHEFGHWVGLNDLYSSIDKDLTMYGYGFTTELKKDSLGTGDITGVRAIQP